jgi:hypothetical protein
MEPYQVRNLRYLRNPDQGRRARVIMERLRKRAGPLEKEAADLLEAFLIELGDDGRIRCDQLRAYYDGDGEDDDLDPDNPGDQAEASFRHWDSVVNK